MTILYYSPGYVSTMPDPYRMLADVVSRLWLGFRLWSMFTVRILSRLPSNLLDGADKNKKHETAWESMSLLSQTLSSRGFLK